MTTQLTMTRGDDETLTVAVVYAGAPVVLTGVQGIRFTAKYRTNQIDAQAVFMKTLGNGVTVTDDVGGLISVDLVPADTVLVADNANLYFDVEVTDSIGKVRTPVKGRLLVEADVSR